MVYRGLERIRNLPEGKRKIILWVILVIIALVLGTFWVKNLKEKINNFQLDEFKQNLNLPKIEIPK